MANRPIKFRILLLPEFGPFQIDSSRAKATTLDGTPTAPPPLTVSIPPDVAAICGIAEAHANTITAALSTIYRADPHAGATLDAVLQKLFYTVTSQALRLASPPPASPTARAQAANPTATGPPTTYAAAAAAQTTPLSQQTHTHPSNRGTTTTKPLYYEEIILHTSRMTLPPLCETIVNVVKSAAGDRVTARAVR
ncbi:hypothetical protein SCUCBS95973_000267 [Sporothrix curviconia]|uniref:Uncharacterized protein n=1 Tax=Sporothrix curviconia TaxID=1260050 RepID=A0ABP0ANS5_9PEZI